MAIEELHRILERSHTLRHILMSRPRSKAMLHIWIHLNFDFIFLILTKWLSQILRQSGGHHLVLPSASDEQRYFLTLAVISCDTTLAKRTWSASTLEYLKQKDNVHTGWKAAAATQSLEACRIAYLPPKQYPTIITPFVTTEVAWRSSKNPFINASTFTWLWRWSHVGKSKASISSTSFLESSDLGRLRRRNDSRIASPVPSQYRVLIYGMYKKPSK